eukprot:Skav236422  [mRNA]  locus=scaffold4816:43572:45113:- [translate_table: standard]
MSHFGNEGQQAERGQTALHEAAMHGHAEAVSALAAARADVEATGFNRGRGLRSCRDSVTAVVLSFVLQRPDAAAPGRGASVWQGPGGCAAAAAARRGGYEGQRRQHGPAHSCRARAGGDGLRAPGGGARGSRCGGDRLPTGSEAAAPRGAGRQGPGGRAAAGAACRSGSEGQMGSGALRTWLQGIQQLGSAVNGFSCAHSGRTPLDVAKVYGRHRCERALEAWAPALLGCSRLLQVSATGLVLEAFASETINCVDESTSIEVHERPHGCTTPCPAGSPTSIRTFEESRGNRTTSALASACWEPYGFSSRHLR